MHTLPRFSRTEFLEIIEFDGPFQEFLIKREWERQRHQYGIINGQAAQDAHQLIHLWLKNQKHRKLVILAVRKKDGAHVITVVHV